MGAIRVDHFAGGQRLQKDHGSPDLAALMRDVADDFAGLQVADIAAADATALAVVAPQSPADASYVQAEATATADSIIELQATVDELVTQGNELKAAINAVAVSGHTILTTKA